jgi:uncharacterized protein
MGPFKIKEIPKEGIILLLKGYRFFVSPFLGMNCRFYPTCSSYAEEALRERGLIMGMYLSLRRLLRCHPWHQGGLDPVPKKENRKK